MKRLKIACAVAMAAIGLRADVEKYDANMVVEKATIQDGMKWIDARNLPVEGRAFDNVDEWYDRLPSGLSTNINKGVHNIKHQTSGLSLRFTTDSSKIVFKWVPRSKSLAIDNMPSTGVSGIDVYKLDGASGKWLYEKTGRIRNAKGASLSVEWKPGTACLVHFPLYNGIKSFQIGIEENATVMKVPERKSGVAKPVVFYGTSITQGGSASRPGMSFVNIIGRDLDVPVVNLGFSGSGLMEREMADHLGAIDASCYVLDCVTNMRYMKPDDFRARYEAFIRALREKKPNVPIVMAGMCDVYGRPPNDKDEGVKALYDRLVAEGWQNLIHLPKEGMLAPDGEGTVDGLHPNDWGMMHLARCYGAAVARALGTKEER